jgi:HK97 family phage prohead protease
MSDMLRLSAQSVTIDAAAGDTPTRTISGIAVPYNQDAIVLGGRKVRILPGALPTDGPPPRLLAEHDTDRVIGIVTDRISTDDGMLFSAKIAKTQAGDELLELLQMGAYDSVSVGLVPIDVDHDGSTVVVKAAEWEELSVVYMPAFQAAKITEIAAAADPEADEPTPEPTEPEEATMSDNDTTTEPIAASAEQPTAPIYASPRNVMKGLPSVGEYLLAMREGGHRWHQINDNIRAATGDVVVSDAAGLVPTPIVTPVYDDIQPLRPIVSALGARSMPAAGSTFLRPKIANHSSVAAQANELANAATADFDLSNVTFTKKTFAGSLLLSEQVIDWSTPSMLDAAVNDLARKYALATEDYVVDQLAAGITNTQEVLVSDITDPAEVISDLFTAASSIATTGNYFPNVLVVSPAKWAALGSLVDASDRPIFPQANPQNAIGTLPAGVTGPSGNPLGLNLIVSNQVGSQAVGNKTATEYLWLMNSRGVECYENYKGFIRQEEAQNLSVRVTVRGYFACEIIDVNMIRILGPDATF